MLNAETEKTKVFAPGGYSFIPGVAQYSAGVAAEANYSIRRVRFSRPVPMVEGFQRISHLLAAAGRPTTAFCSCELRIPERFTETSFKTFNTTYSETLAAWGLIGEHGNPVTRSCVAPELDAPAEPSFFAFCYTVMEEAPPTFVIAGSGEVPEGKGNYRDHIVRLGDLSDDAMEVKAHWVVDEMERRMSAFGGDWHGATSIQIYTVHDLRKILQSVLTPRGVSTAGVTWHFSRPPVVDIEYEMDCRRIHHDTIHDA